MKLYAKPLAALFLCCLPFFPAPLIAQDATAGQTQTNPAGAGSTGAVTPVDPSVAPAAETVAPANPDTGSDASVNSASGETTNPPSTAGDNEKTAAVNLLNNRIGPNYLIGPEDILSIDVFDVPELSKFDVQVGNDGTITVPLIGAVKAAGLTQAQLRDELAQEWGRKYLNHPQVTLYLKEFKSRPVYVVGSVAKPGVYYMTGRRTLVEVLAMAGGLAGGGAGAGKELFVERASGFEDLPQQDGINQIAPDKVSVQLKKLLYSEDSALNIELKPFDTVSVSRPGIVYLAGAFNRPGGYVLTDKDTITVLEAVAMAGGIGGNARTSEAKIIRRSSESAISGTTIPIDLKKIMRGRSPDLVLAANDIFLVPNSTAKGIAKGTASSVMGIVSGLVIYRGL
ncbi:MAG TPA: polysaccharide biosynthesis/export family protein [Terriglobia bacterium]|nr:polysaccharide biosynthesis/export family protein [Terriglobia bacterium]